MAGVREWSIWDVTSDLDQCAVRAQSHTAGWRCWSFKVNISMSIPGVTLYERIGGAEAVAGMVDRFYMKVIADPNLRPYFDHAALDKLQHMQVEFFSAALDGPIRYTGRPVIHAHHGLGITRQHFQLFVEHLFETLADYPLSEQDRYEIISRINTYSDDVLGSGSGPVE